MSKKMVELFATSITKKWHLRRNNERWQLEENNIEIEFKTPNCYSLGFSLDKPNKFPFLNNKPPKNIAKMCDGIIAMSYKNKVYIFLIEQKTINEGQYKKQLVNGWHFCQWLLGLFKEHNYYDGKVCFIGLLYKKSKKSIHKQPTTHKKTNPLTSVSQYSIFETNQPVTYLQQYCDA